MALPTRRPVFAPQATPSPTAPIAANLGAQPLVHTAKAGPNAEKVSAIQSRLRGASSSEALALVPKDLGDKVRRLEDRIRDLERENGTLKQGVRGADRSGAGGPLENLLLRNALEETKDELHRERTEAQRERESHLLQQIHSLMREKSALAGRVEELQKRNALLLEEIEHLRAGER